MITLINKAHRYTQGAILLVIITPLAYCALVFLTLIVAPTTIYLQFLFWSERKEIKAHILKIMKGIWGLEKIARTDAMNELIRFLIHKSEQK